MNKSILLGRLTRDPEIRYSQSNNVKVASFTLAVNRKYAKEGEERQADFINIVVYSKLVEFVEKYLKQGLQVCICGRIQTRTWEDSTGQRRYATEVVAEEINFADSPKKTEDESILSASSKVETEQTNSDNCEVMGDDLPF